MNIYGCVYKGNRGYCCRRHNMNWMFVPDLGQVDNKVYKNISFDEIFFENSFDRKLEQDFQVKLDKTGIIGLLHNFVRRKDKPQTIGGLLFCSYNL